MNATRDKFIDTTCELLEAQGYNATGLNQIISKSGAPKGSLYYYFPDGKEGLAAAAIERTGTMLAERVKMNLAEHPSPAEAVRAFVHRIAQGVEVSGFRAGGPLTTVAMETAATGDRLNLACRDAYMKMQAEFAAELGAGGFSEQRAAQLAVFIVSAIEGGIILSRTLHSGDPLRRVAEELGRLLQADWADTARSAVD